MHREGNEVVLDQHYEHEAGIVPARFPVTGISNAITSIRAQIDQLTMHERQENLRLYGGQPAPDEETAMIPRKNYLSFMLKDLERLS
jgi:hypothetical protein